MLLKKFSLYFTALFSSIILITLFITEDAHAAIISPPVMEETYEPGQIYERELTVYFTKQDPEILYISVAKLGIEDGTGDKSVIIPDSNERTLANWITLSDTKAIKPEGIEYKNEDNRVIIPFEISIPIDAAGGSDYAVILVSQRAPEGTNDGVNSEVTISAEVTLQLLATLEGERNIDTKLVKFQTKNNKFFHSHLPVEFETIIKNNGNIHLIPEGEVGISLFGREIKDLELNTRGLRVFPQKSRLYENIWSEEGIEDLNSPEDITKAREDLPHGFIESLRYEIKHFRIGVFKAELTGQMVGEDAPFSAETTFIVIPWHILSIVLLIIIIIVLLELYSNRRKRRN